MSHFASRVRTRGNESTVNLCCDIVWLTFKTSGGSRHRHWSVRLEPVVHLGQTGHFLRLMHSWRVEGLSCSSTLRTTICLHDLVLRGMLRGRHRSQLLVAPRWVVQVRGSRKFAPIQLLLQLLLIKCLSASCLRLPRGSLQFDLVGEGCVTTSMDQALQDCRHAFVRRGTVAVLSRTFLLGAGRALVDLLHDRLLSYSVYQFARSRQLGHREDRLKAYELCRVVLRLHTRYLAQRVVLKMLLLSRFIAIINIFSSRSICRVVNLLDLPFVIC